jgi:uncharacterized membrane protein YphA (DoxX/SURF4 family)
MPRHKKGWTLSTLTILSLLLGICYIGGGLAKLGGVGVMRADAERFKIPYSKYRLIGVAEVAGGIGLAAGPWLSLLGVAAAAGLALLMAGAVLTHVRAQDPPGRAVPAGIFGLSVLTIGLLHVVS